MGREKVAGKAGWSDTEKVKKMAPIFIQGVSKTMIAESPFLIFGNKIKKKLKYL